MAYRFEHRASSSGGSATSLTKRPRIEHNPRSPVSSCSGIAVGAARGKDVGKNIKNLAPGHMRNLQKQVRDLLDSNIRLKRKRPINDDEGEDPNAAPLLWISKWVDYSDKYGFGYQLSDNSIGVIFKDMSRMVYLPDGTHTQYMEKCGTELYYKKCEYPTELQNKVKLLNQFQQYMNENLLKADSQAITSETAQATRLPNMWTWFRTSRAVVMVLSNGTLQINNLRDHTKVILCPLMGAITTLDHHKPMKTYKFSLLKEHGCSKVLYKKLQYALEKLDVVVGSCIKCREHYSPSIQ